MNNRKQQKIEQILQWVESVSGIEIITMADQIRNNERGFSGTLDQYNLNEALRKSVETYISGEYDACFVRLSVLIKLLVERLEPEYFTPDNLDGYANILHLSATNLRAVMSEIDIWKKDAKEELSHSPLYKSSVDFNADDVLQIRNSIGNRYFSLYKYRNGRPIGKVSKYKVKDMILASDSMNNLITSSDLDDTWSVTVGLYIERRIDLSYFVITFSLNGNVYILTDKPQYKNPDQIDRLRGGGRRFSEDRERNLDFLPYILIDKVIENRNNSKDIVKEAGSEIWTFPLKDWFGFQLYYIMKYTIINICQEQNATELLSASSAMLALTDGSVNMKDDSNFSNINIDELNEIVDELYSEQSTTIVPLNSTMIERIGASTELMTIKEFERNSQYLAHKDIVMEHEKAKWGELYDSNDYSAKNKEFFKQKRALLDLFYRKKDEMAQYLFSGDKVYLHDIDKPYVYYGSTFSGKGDEKLRSNLQFVTRQYDFDSFVTEFRGSCLSGDGFKIKEGFCISFVFHRYSEIISILNVGRNDIPPLFRDYLSNISKPYIGNSILDNVKPEFSALEQDFASKNDPNGLIVTFQWCGRCNKRLFKKWKIAEESVIVISSKEHRVIEVITKDEFNKNYIDTEVNPKDK